MSGSSCGSSDTLCESLTDDSEIDMDISDDDSEDDDSLNDLNELPVCTPSEMSPVAISIHAVLDTLEAQNLSLDIFMHGLFYNESLPELRKDQRIKNVRRDYLRSERLAQVLSNQRLPPRTSAKGRRSSNGKRPLETFAFDTVCEILRKELNAFGKTLKTKSIDSAPEETTDTDSIVQATLINAQKCSPKLLELLTAISDPKSEGKSDAKADRRVG